MRPRCLFFEGHFFRLRLRSSRPGVVPAVAVLRFGLRGGSLGSSCIFVRQAIKACRPCTYSGLSPPAVWDRRTNVSDNDCLVAPDIRRVTSCVTTAAFGGPRRSSSVAKWSGGFIHGRRLHPHANGSNATRGTPPPTQIDNLPITTRRVPTEPPPARRPHPGDTHRRS